MKLRVLCVVATALFGAPLAAQVAPGQPADTMAGTASAPAAKPAADPNKPICRREAATGSNMTRRVCHTKAEWDAMTDTAGNTLNSLRRTNSGH